MTSCKICLDMFVKYERISMTDCGCRFHKFCLASWYKINNTCPLCNEIQDGVKKPVDIEIKIEVTQTHTDEFTHNLIAENINNKIGRIVFVFEKYGKPISSITWEKSFKDIITPRFLNDLNKSCRKLNMMNNLN